MRQSNSFFTTYLEAIFNRIFDPLPIPVIMVDKDAKIRLINQVFVEFLETKKESLLGKHVLEVDKNSRFPYVLKNKKAEIAWKHRFVNGHTAIVHRIPVLDDDGEVLYGFGMVLFQDLEDFREIVNQNAQLKSELLNAKRELKNLKEAKYKWENIIGDSEKMIRAKYIGKKAALTHSNVLLLGESGTGKELFAQAIHNDSGRNKHPFVQVNCAAIPDNLFESELFGYEEGAFTGAKKGGKIGKFELANKGTIFLDEIGDLPLSLQVKLLRVLQENEVQRIGGNQTISLDVRVIAATNKDLRQLIDTGKFREDLYYRLNIMTIEIPPLRDRKTDIKAIVQKLIKHISNRLGKYTDAIDEHALQLLKAYHWPGNVRELENVLERAINMADDSTITASDLPNYIMDETLRHKVRESKSQRLSDMVAMVEKELIQNALIKTKNNKKKAAEILDISRSTLYEKINFYQLN